MRQTLLAMPLLFAVGCSSGTVESELAGAWVGTVTTEGDVTTVVNEMGSVWGGPAELVEDLSIGVEAGEDAYMFGRIVGLDTTDDRVYVADSQRLAIRAYDLDGNHLFDFGREGQGPGEFDRIARLAVDPAGRVLVQGNSRITVFDLDGNLLDTWPHAVAGLDQFLTVGPGGTTYVPSSWSEEGQRRAGFLVVSPNGEELDRITGPQYDDSSWRLEAEGPSGTTSARVRVPYSPRAHWTVTASGALVAGAATAYSFSVTHADRELIIERAIPLPEVPAAERDWQVASVRANLRRFQPDWQWEGPSIPERVPAYLVFLPDRYGRIWALRQLGFEPVAECDPDPAGVEDPPARPCHEPIYGFDAFDEEDGRFLGQVRLPGWFRNPPHWAEHALWWAVEDERGTIMVKRYRLVLPGEQ